MDNKYLDCCLEVGDNIRPFIQQGQTGKKYLYFRITRKKNGPDQFGKTHNISVRYKDVTGQYQTVYVGSATEKDFPNQQGYSQQPAQGGYAPQGQYRQPAPPQGQSATQYQQGYQQAQHQGAAEIRQQYQNGYAPQGQAVPPQNNFAPQAQQNMPPQAPPLTYADAPQDDPNSDLPF